MTDRCKCGILKIVKNWKHKNAIYQIYPRSFKDANRDGVGDIRGVIENLEYLKGSPHALGVDAIWLSPFYTSPMRDFGYDVENYRDVDPLFGTLQDIDELIKKAHERDLAVMIDLIPNHTSSQHPWFQEAIANPKSDKRKYYVFRDAKPDGSPPNNWLSIFGGSAWKRDESSGQYYLHSFLEDQPDLNWANPKVRDEMREIVKFWLARGIDGIRVDAVRCLAKDPEFRDDPHNTYYQQTEDPYQQLLHINSQFHQKLEEYLRVITDTAKEFGDIFIVFEDYPDGLSSSREQIMRMYSVSPENAAPFEFFGMYGEWSAEYYCEAVQSFLALVPDNGMAVPCFGNHDRPRIVSRFGRHQAKLIGLFELTIPGIPVIYYGDELGMKDGEIARHKLQDPFELQVPGKRLGRDPQRTPMQWKPTQGGGFSRARRTWLPLTSNFRSTNVETELHIKTSFLNMYRKLLQFRSEHAALRNGRFGKIACDDNVLMYVRSGATKKFIVALNFNDSRRHIELQVDGRILCGTDDARTHEIKTGHPITLKPYEGILIDIS